MNPENNNTRTRWIKHGAFYTCLALSILACLPWPIVAFLSIFLFDAPIRGIADGIVRYSLALICLTYPWGLGAGLAHFITHKRKTAWKPWVSCVLLLSPYLQIGLFVAIFFLFGKGGPFDISPDPVLERHSVIENIHMEIRSDDSYDAQWRQIGYSIVKHDESMRDIWFLGKQNEYKTSNGFVEYMGTNNDIACYTWGKYPDTIAIMINTKSCESWPRTLPRETQRENLARGEEWLRLFKMQPNETRNDGRIDILRIDKNRSGNFHLISREN